METPNRLPLPVIDSPVIIEDRRGVGTRHRVPRMKILKGAQIYWLTGTPVKCLVRNLSEMGAKIEVHSPVPENFDLVFDGDQTRHPCRVVWRKEILLGVQFV
jgi:hypothetical protein